MKLSLLDCARRAELLAKLAACALLLSAGSVARADDASLFEVVRAADLRLATVGWRLASENAPLCDQIEAGTGLQLHTLDQFNGSAREAAAKHFGFATPVAVEGVVAGSPAERAGLRPDDSLVRVGPVDIASLPGRPGTTGRLVAAQLAIAALPADAEIGIDLIRAGVPTHVTIRTARACKSRFELELDDGFGASADGVMVQVGSGFLKDYPDDQLAAVVAHEFSHNILRHRARLEAQGVDYGLLAGFGANVKYFRQTETEADLLSIYLLANAKYDPHASIRFWQKFGPSKAGGPLRSRSHPAWRDRVATLEAEIGKIETASAHPIVPSLLMSRDIPLSGDWQSILVRHP